MDTYYDLVNYMTYLDALLLGLRDFFIWAKWLMLLALLLTFADLKFGVDKAKYKKEEVRFSRAWKRTINKIIGFIGWITVAYAFGQAFGLPFDIPLLPLFILLIIYILECQSVYSNYFAARGKNYKVNLFKFFSKKTDIIEIEEESEDETRSN